MKKTIIFLHGFFASGSCVPANALREAFDGKVRVLTPDLPKHPKEALEFIHQLCDKEKPEMSMRVEKIFIMKSERIEGALIYSEVLSNSY